jgi:hypothetical protein
VQRDFRFTPAIVLQRLNMKKTNEVMNATAPRRRPVRVKLQRVDAGSSKTYPPDGQGKIWWARLKEALGTSSSDFVNASLFQLQRAAQLPCSGISELAMNASLAMIEAAAPQNEIEGALAVQMVCAHSAAIAVLARFGGGGASEARAVALASAAARLMRAFSTQVETLRRLRHGGDQYVRVEHVHVNEGGQTVIGNIRTQGGKRAQLVGNQVLGDDLDEEGAPTHSR